MLGVEDEIERLDRIIIASENWSKLYSKTPDIHAKLIKAEAKLGRQIRAYFKDLSLKSSQMVNWSEYQKSIKAASVDIVVNNVLDDSANEFIKLTFDVIAVATALGAQSGEELYNRALGLTSLDATIQSIALGHVAGLVGMKVNSDGSIVPNPKAELNILDTTRDDIRQSIATSIGLGEDIVEATDRLSNVIYNPDRAELIARTETVNSFGDGLLEFGNQTDAVGKEWQDVGATDECADNADQGPIPYDDQFQSGDDAPAAHPNCRCSMRLIYQNELDDNPNLFD